MTDTATGLISVCGTCWLTVELHRDGTWRPLNHQDNSHPHTVDVRDLPHRQAVSIEAVLDAAARGAA